MNNTGEVSGARACEFSGRVSDMHDLSEMAANLQSLASEVEIRLLGHKPEAEREGLNVDRKSDMNFVAELRYYTNETRRSLHELSDSLNRLHNELGGIGEECNAPKAESPNRALSTR